MFPYEVFLDICKFLSRFDLLTLQLSSRRLRQFVADNAFYWPRHRCYRLTFLEFFAINTLCRAENLSDFPVDFSKKLSDRLSALQFAPSEDRVQLFLNETEPTFLLFEFTSGRKFYVQIGPFITSQNVANLVFWLQQISDVFFEEEIRGMPKFSAQFLEWIRRNEFAQIIRLRCKTFGCYEFEPFDQLDVQFNLNYLQAELMDKANGTIFSSELFHLLFNGAPHIKSFSTRWVMNCGTDFTDQLIEHAANSTNPEKMIPSIRFTPSFHRQRELPIPARSLVPSAAGNVKLIKREEVRFRVVLFIYNDAETGEEAISQFSITNTS
uniref:F-box domain-containing protein n=1 Tax=Globodera rostochiensis TaxID=31243 RepID=A0A914GU51_GLORO